MKSKNPPCINCGHSKCSHRVNLYYQKICKPNCGCKKYSLTEVDIEFTNKWHKAGWEDGARESEKQIAAQKEEIDNLRKAWVCNMERLEHFTKEISRLKKIIDKFVDASYGLSCGKDWNNGTHAILHGYRQKLLDALSDAKKHKKRGSYHD